MPVGSSRGNGHRIVNCRVCDKEMKTYASDNRGKGKYFCSTSCADAGLFVDAPKTDCPHCKEEFSQSRLFRRAGPSGFTHKVYCSVTCRNRATNDKKKKVWLDKNGYPCKSQNGKQVFLHREAMEKMLGRKLLSHETVHHKNGNRSDFSNSNLELWSSRHGKGQRVEDKLAFAWEMIALYMPKCEPSTLSHHMTTFGL